MLIDSNAKSREATNIFIFKPAVEDSLLVTTVLHAHAFA